MSLEHLGPPRIYRQSKPCTKKPARCSRTWARWACKPVHLGVRAAENDTDQSPSKPRSKYTRLCWKWYNSVPTIVQICGLAKLIPGEFCIMETLVDRSNGWSGPEATNPANRKRFFPSPLLRHEGSVRTRCSKSQTPLSTTHHSHYPLMQTNGSPASGPKSKLISCNTWTRLIFRLSAVTDQFCYRSRNDGVSAETERISELTVYKPERDVRLVLVVHINRKTPLFRQKDDSLRLQVCMLIRSDTCGTLGAVLRWVSTMLQNSGLIYPRWWLPQRMVIRGTCPLWFIYSICWIDLSGAKWYCSRWEAPMQIVRVLWNTRNCNSSSRRDALTKVCACEQINAKTMARSLPPWSTPTYGCCRNIFETADEIIIQLLVLVS